MEPISEELKIAVRFRALQHSLFQCAKNGYDICVPSDKADVTEENKTSFPNNYVFKQYVIGINRKN
jgi:hypothetical protein